MGRRQIGHCPAAGAAAAAGPAAAALLDRLVRPRLGTRAGTSPSAKPLLTP